VGVRGVEPLAKKATPMKYKMCAGGSKKCCPVREQNMHVSGNFSKLNKYGPPGKF